MKYDVLIKISIISLVILVLFLAILIIFYPSIKLNGGDITLNYKEEYQELGAYTTRFKRKINIKNNINYNKLGTYEVVYSYKLGFIKRSIIRNVTIIDKVKPIITLEGNNEINICPNKEYEEIGYKAIDNYDGDITNKVTKDIKDDIITYNVVDSSGNNSSITRTIKKIDTTKPVITLKGSTVYLYVGSKYSEPGYTAKDNCDDDLTKKVKITNNVNSSKVGTYYVTYTVTDSNNNKVSIKRKVIVRAKIADSKVTKKGTIYLTFDDGPSNYTKEILDILKKYNIKATFFVTGNGSNSIIKREYLEGHTVGLHTYSHNYKTVYSSAEGYFNDLEKISNRVYKITGQKSNIIRFPGGSSNAVSKNYSKGIMTYLTGEVIKRGYRYYDWNISSGDASGRGTSASVYNNVTKALNKNRANIVLMHDTKEFTKNALEKIIQYGLNNGYSFLPITNDTKMVTHHVCN